ncbi:glucose 1-dehydrogenase [Thalassotalea psychrophila]|uniref:Glucose 1-dehydrogenase n=1 Tax=Thalassotalea psychrophila TaxID=3065647 RepID=A0ABY9TZC2_9GAMM|nr:glucose 1-dehydrogenase [Colwelliaceae bacterium SQ149]
MSERLINKVVLVTGGGSGIGEAICMQFSNNGAVVVVSDVNEHSAEKVACTIRNNGGKATALKLDVSCEDNWDVVIAQIKIQQGKLDVLVNNAGIGLPGNVEDQSMEDWQLTEKINVHGVFLGMQKSIAMMKVNGGGNIINISSIDGLVGDAMAIAYNASKGSVRLMTKSAALHCAKKQYGIRVNSVHPGYILTPLVQEQMLEAEPAWRDEYIEQKVSRVPMGQMGQPDDIAHGCVYLASDEAKYVTGAEIVIDGGFTAT